MDDRRPRPGGLRSLRGIAGFPVARVASYGGSIWVAYVDDKQDVYVRRSRDGGKVFDPAVPVADERHRPDTLPVDGE